MSDRKIPEKSVIAAEVLSNEKIAGGIIKMTVAAPQFAEEAQPGQFCNLYPAADRLILPRPVSICDAEKESGTLTFVYAVVGAGTEEFSKLKSGQSLRVSSPLGKGFRMPSGTGQKAVLIGGGVGTAPMLFLAKELKKRNLKSRLILQVHDELLIEAEEYEVEEVKEILKDQMENAASLSVPLLADMHTGKNWYEAK